MNERGIGIVEVARTLGVHRQTVWRLIKEKRLRAVMVSPGRRVVLQSELNRYFESLTDRETL
jgi:excisionase family DNA binding protein